MRTCLNTIIFNLHKAEDMFSYDFADFEIEGYDPHPTIKAQVSV